jgi:hypothetical protein
VGGIRAGRLISSRALLAILAFGILPLRVADAQDSASVERAHRDSIFAPIGFNEYLRGMVGPRSTFRALALAGFDQWRQRPRSEGRTWRGFEDRLGSRYGQVAISHTLRFAASRMFEERNLRYWPCGCGDSSSRLFNALTGPFRVTSLNGIHYSALNPVTEIASGILVTGVSSGGLHVGEGVRNGVTGILGESVVDVVREFWPWHWRPPFL